MIVRPFRRPVLLLAAAAVILCADARAFNPRLRVELDLLWQQTEQLIDLYSDNELYLRVRVFQAF